MRGLSLFFVLLLSVCLCNVFVAASEAPTASGATEAPTASGATETPTVAPASPFTFVQSNISITFDGPAPVDRIRTEVANLYNIDPSKVTVTATQSNKRADVSYIISVLVQLGYFTTADANTKASLLTNLVNSGGLGSDVTVVSVQAIATAYGCVAGTHLADGNQCTCTSGFGGAACEITPQTSSCSMATSLAQSTNQRPLLNEDNSASFHGNNLELSIFGPTVTNRTYTGLSFKHQTGSKCSIGSVGSYWTNQLRTAGGCRDQFKLVMPWTDHNSCAFTMVPHPADQGYSEFKAVMELSYSDHYFITAPLNTMLERKSKVFYTVFVRFPTLLNVSKEMVLVFANMTVKFALTQFKFDAEKNEMDVAATTIVDWPNMLHDHAMDITLPGSDWYLTSPLTLQDDRCADTQDTFCQQTFRFKMARHTGCTFDGNYILNFTAYTCRDADAAVNYKCTHNTFGIIFTVEDSDVCGSVSLNPQVQGQLIAQESDLNTPKMQFEVGTTAYFFVDVTTGLDNNKVYVTFKDISFEVTGSVNAKTYLLQNFVTATAGGIDTSTNFTYSNDAYRFAVYLHGNFFRVDPNQIKQYTFRAKAVLTFEGNQKRSEQEVEVFWEAPAGSSVDSKLNIGVAGSAISENKAAAAPAARSLVAPIAGGLSALVVVAAIAAVIIKKRSAPSNEYTSVL